MVNTNAIIAANPFRHPMLSSPLHLPVTTAVLTQTSDTDLTAFSLAFGGKYSLF